MRASYPVTCPYCNFEGPQSFVEYGPNIGLCDGEEGGCNKYFVYEFTVKVSADSWKIEGKE